MVYVHKLSNSCSSIDTTLTWHICSNLFLCSNMLDCAGTHDDIASFCFQEKCMVVHVLCKQVRLKIDRALEASA